MIVINLTTTVNKKLLINRRRRQLTLDNNKPGQQLTGNHAKLIITFQNKKVVEKGKIEIICLGKKLLNEQTLLQPYNERESIPEERKLRK